MWPGGGGEKQTPVGGNQGEQVPDELEAALPDGQTSVGALTHKEVSSLSPTGFRG